MPFLQRVGRPHKQIPVLPKPQHFAFLKRWRHTVERSIQRPGTPLEDQIASDV